MRILLAFAVIVQVISIVRPLAGVVEYLRSRAQLDLQRSIILALLTEPIA